MAHSSLTTVTMPKLSSSGYDEKLVPLQERLRNIQHTYLFSKDSAVVVFEGWDAAGKGGAIRRITTLMDPRGVKVWPISAPRDYFKERHYMARFWEKLPPRGALSIFDRSWYGRVLVERVEGFATEAEWQRAYDEINSFEKQLVDDGTRVIKFFLHITPDEQLQRFQDRLSDPYKRWKLSYEDFRNRKAWPAYVEAIEEMLAKTSTDHAPWHVIGGNNKKHARIEIMSILADALEKGVDLSPRPIDPELANEAAKVLMVEN